MSFSRSAGEEGSAHDETRHLGDSFFFYDARTTTSVEEMRRSLLERCFPGDGVGSGCLSLLSTAVTPSMLALPLAFSLGGFSFSIACIFFCIFITIMSVRILALASASAASDDYASVAGFFLGAKGMWLARTVLFFYNFGCGVVYLCFLKDVIASIITVKGTFLPIWMQGNYGGLLTFVFLVACVTPFMFKSRLASLRTMGFASNILTIFIIISIVYRFFVPLHSQEMVASSPPKAGGERSRVAVWELILPYLFVIPIFVFSYEVQSNVMGVIKDLHDRRGDRIFLCICLALAMATLFYIPLSVFGSLSFPHISQGNILALYDIRRDNLMFLCQVFCCYSAATSFVFCMFPCRFEVFMLISGGTAARVPKVYRVRIGAALSFFAVCCAIFLPDVAKVVSLLGALFSSTLSMTLPALFALKMRWSGTYLTSAPDEYVSWLLFFFGILISIAGTLVAVLDALDLADDL